jgi:hypothetical protein
MSTSLAELEPQNGTGTAVAVVDVSDALTKYADAFAPQYIIGKMLRFSKGDWLVNKDDKVDTGTKFTVNLDELLAGWIKWLDSKPVEHLMVPIASGAMPKLRPELGDLDQALWERDRQGTPKDPWQFTNYLPMLDERGELYTFTTSSRGGIGAIARLGRQYAKHRRRHPDVFPLIAINNDSYQHKIKELGRIKFPVFEPAGYVSKTDFLAALATAGYASANTNTDVEPESEGPEDDFNDAIPY